jgi:hypothetical protein
MKHIWRMKLLLSLRLTRTSCRRTISSKNKIYIRKNQLFGEKKQFGALNLSSFMTRVSENRILNKLPFIRSNQFTRSKNHVKKTTMIEITMIPKIGGIN